MESTCGQERLGNQDSEGAGGSEWDPRYRGWGAYRGTCQNSYIRMSGEWTRPEGRSDPSATRLATASSRESPGPLTGFRRHGQHPTPRGSVRSCHSPTMHTTGPEPTHPATTEGQPVTAPAAALLQEDSLTTEQAVAAIAAGMH